MKRRCRFARDVLDCEAHVYDEITRASELFAKIFGTASSKISGPCKVQLIGEQASQEPTDLLFYHTSHEENHRVVPIKSYLPLDLLESHPQKVPGGFRPVQGPPEHTRTDGHGSHCRSCVSCTLVHRSRSRREQDHTDLGHRTTFLLPPLALRTHR